MTSRAVDAHISTQNDRERVPDVTVSIANWNRANLLARCLASLQDQTAGVSVEVIVVDNASTDNSVALVREQFPGVHLILNEDNKGFAVAHNQAIRASSGRYVLLLNNDAWVEPDTIATMVRFADSHPQVGIVGPRVLTKDGPLQVTYGPMPTLWRILFPDRLYKQQAEAMAWGKDIEARQRVSADFIPKYGFDRVHEVDNVSGVCLLARRSMIDEIGLLDEGFFMYYEDLDWCARAVRKKYRIYYLPEAIVCHELHPLVEKPYHCTVAARRGQIRFIGKREGLLAMWVLGLLTLGAILGKLIWLRLKSLQLQEWQDSGAVALRQLIRDIIADLAAGLPSAG